MLDSVARWKVYEELSVYLNAGQLYRAFHFTCFWDSGTEQQNQILPRNLIQTIITHNLSCWTSAHTISFANLIQPQQFNLEKTQNLSRHNKQTISIANFPPSQTRQKSSASLPSPSWVAVFHGFAPFSASHLVGSKPATPADCELVGSL